MKTQRFIGVLITVGLVAFAAVLCTVSCSQQTADIKIGFVGTLSGPASWIGTEMKRGAEIAIAEINASGGIRGHKLALVDRDDEFEPKNTVARYRELVEREKVVAMLGAVNSASMLAVTPLVNDTLKVPVICPGSDATAITENDAKQQKRDNYLFRVGMYGFGQANFLADTAVKKLGYSKIGILTWTGGWGVTGRAELLRRLKELGVAPVADETYDNNDTDMTAQILKLKKAEAEVILNYGQVRDNTFVVKTKELLHDVTPYLSAWGITGRAFWNAAGKSAEGVCVSTTVTMDGPQSPERLAFLREYRARYGEEMVAGVFAMGAYDAVYLFKAAMEKRGFEPDKIRNGLEEITEFKGLIKHFHRPVFTRERHNAITEDDMVLTRWTDGKLLEIKFDGKRPFVEPDGTTKKYLDTKTMQLQ